MLRYQIGFVVLVSVFLELGFGALLILAYRLVISGEGLASTKYVAVGIAGIIANTVCSVLIISGLIEQAYSY